MSGKTSTTLALQAKSNLRRNEQEQNEQAPLLSLCFMGSAAVWPELRIGYTSAVDRRVSQNGETRSNTLFGTVLLETCIDIADNDQ
ncbi:hypothetical protein FRC02_011734 [Tulasnella sp. 418]|nr:hypothetical protein FRC02_011734 [Tulasnella sp. 418]